MKGKFIFLFIFLISLSCYSQSKKKPKKKKRSDDHYYVPIVISYGNNIYQNNFNNSLGTFNSVDINKTISLIGIGINYGVIISARGYTRPFMRYSQVIPKTILIDDTLKAKINGFNYSMDLSFLRFFKNSKNVQLSLCIGFNTGRLKINSSQINQKNPFFEPKFSIHNSYIIKRFSIHWDASYFYDISKLGWRNAYFSPENKIPIQPFNQTGVNLSFGIGYGIR